MRGWSAGGADKKSVGRWMGRWSVWGVEGRRRGEVEREGEVEARARGQREQRAKRKEEKEGVGERRAEEVCSEAGVNGRREGE